MQDLKPWIGDPPLTEPPQLPGYELHAHERINMVTASLMGLPLIIVWFIGFPILVSLTTGDVELSLNVGSLTDVIVLGIYFILAFALMVLLHEGIHGLVAAVQGARPAFGVGPGFAYTTVRESLSRNGYLAVAIAPAIIISVGCFLLAIAFPDQFGWWLAISTLNASGLGGDFWMFGRLLKVPSYARIVDLADGFAVYLPNRGSWPSTGHYATTDKP